MTFEEILPGLKAKKKYVRTGWGGAENYVQLFDSIEQNGVALEVSLIFSSMYQAREKAFPCGVRRLVTY